MLIAHHAASLTKRCDIAQKTALYYTENSTILHEKMHYIARENALYCTRNRYKRKEDMPFLTYPPIIDVD